MNGQSMRQGDRSLLKYEKALKQMARKGQIDLPMDDELVDVILNNIEPIELTNNEIRKLSLGLRTIHQDKAIEQAKKLLSSEKLSFGQYLQSLRCKAELTIGEIARRLKVESSYLENVEADIVSPLDIVRDKITDIMELFKIPFSDFVKTVEESLTLAQARTGQVKAIARSSYKVGSKERGTEVSHAIDAALIEIAKMKKQISEKDIQINEKYLKEIREELAKRNRKDLLI